MKTLAICSCFAKFRVGEEFQIETHITSYNNSVHKWVYYSYIAKSRRNWQPYVARTKEDWKDFRYSVCRTHTWYDVSENLYQVIGSFEAWCNQEVYCIKDYKPCGYLNKEWNYSGYRVVKIDGMSYKEWFFFDYDQALEYIRTDPIKEARCHSVVYNIYYRKMWDTRVTYEGKVREEYKKDPDCVEKLKYCLITTKKKQLEFTDLEEGITYMKANKAEVLPFRLGNSSEPPIDKNWLKNMTSGTRFLASRRSQDTHELDDFIVSSDPKSMDAVFLGKNLSLRDGCFRFVDPVKFSKDYDLFMTLEIIEIPDGNSDKVQAGTVDSDGKPEVVHDIHEEK